MEEDDIASVVSFACIDGGLYFSTNVDFVVAGVDSLVSIVDEGLLMKHYV